MLLKDKPMKVSFIVPVYKVEKYLSKCIESILCQTYKDFEIILVDDGSPDNSGKLCDAYVQKDSRIKVLHKANGGLSDARNAGLSVAKGEWVIFLDSDDFWLEKDNLENLMKIAESNSTCDFIGFNCSYYYEDNESFVKWVEYNDGLSVPTEKNLVMNALVASGTMPMSACLKLSSRKFLQDMQLFFIKGIHAEDIPWFIDLLDGCSKCMFVNQYIYAYRQDREGSITHSGGEKSFNNLFSILKNELAKIDSRSFSLDAKDALRSFLAYEYCILLAMLGSLDKSIQKEKRKELYDYKWLLKYTMNPKVKKVALVNKLFGISITERVLRLYLNKLRK